MIRLLIVAEQESTRHALRMRLSAETDLSVVGDVYDYPTAVGAAKRLLPQVILVDADVMCAHDIVAQHELQALCLMSPVIILTLHEDVCAREHAAAIHAAALLSKLVPVETLLCTIRAVAQDGIT
ncbi:MAG: hypothetical protein ACP5HS_09500 [Anaerolineae bacterium]